MINLWELLTRVRNSEKSPAQERAEEAGNKLRESACMPWQNVSVAATDDGWLLTVNSTYETGEVAVLVPNDRDRPAEIVKDSRAESVAYGFDTLFDQGRFAEAARAAEESLISPNDQPPPDSPEEALLRQRLARTYMKLGNFHRAELLYQQAIDIRAPDLDKADADLVRLLSEWATLHYLYHCNSEEEFAETESRFRQAQDVAKRALPSDHPESARLMTSLARFRMSQYEHEDASDLLNKALAIQEKSLGETHVDVADTLLQLARLNALWDLTGDAESQYQRALRIRQQSLGTDHPDTAEILFNLADLYYYNLKRPVIAASLLKQALDVWERTLGLDHPLVEQEGNFIRAVLPDLADADEEDLEDGYDDDVEF